MKRVLGLIVFCCVLVAAPAQAEEKGREYTLKGAEGAVVQVKALKRAPSGRMGMAGGCGVVVRGALVVSAWHIVNEAVAVTIIDQLGNQYPAERWDRMDGSDVCTIWLVKPASHIEGVGLYEGKVVDGTPVMAIFFFGRDHNHRLPAFMYGRAYPSIKPLPGALDGLGGPNIPCALPAKRGMSGSPLFIGGRLAGVCSHGAGAGPGYGGDYWAALPGVKFPGQDRLDEGADAPKEK